jgi:hypothetical protein
MEICVSLSTPEVKSALEALSGGEDIIDLLRQTKFYDDRSLASIL